jgi:putative nucleotidyltransferase with HDIG domain
LAREFSAPVGLFDPHSNRWCLWSGASAQDYPELDQLGTSILQVFARRTGKVHVTRPRDEVNRTWLVMILDPLTCGDLVAAAPFHAAGPQSAMPRVGRTGGGAVLGAVFSASTRQTPSPPCGATCPEPALKAWGEQVASRVQETIGGGVPPSTRGAFPSTADHQVIGRLIRRMRISDHPRRFQALTANVVRTSLGVEAVAWVPADSFEPVIVSGEVAGFAESGYRTLAPVSLKESAYVTATPRGESDQDDPGAVRRYAVVTGGSVGWLIAANPADDHPLDGAELEIMQFAASLITAQLNNAKIYGDLKELLFGIIRALTSAIDAKDPYTCGHSERVARIAVRLAEEMGVAPQKRSDLYLAGLLHDIGKIGIDDEVLKKSGPLSAEEYRRIQSHVEIGVTILNDLRKLHHILPGVRHHHESHDGTGYPDHLSGEDIPLEARILAVADSFDAMSSNRPYRRRLTPNQIDEILRKGRGTQWDPQVIDALFDCRMDLEAIRQKGLGDSLLGAVDVTLGRR